MGNGFRWPLGSAKRACRWAVRLALAAGLGISSGGRATAQDSAAFDDLKRMVEMQQQQIRQLQAQAAAQQQAGTQVGQIPAIPAAMGYETPAAPVASGSAPAAAAAAAALPPGATIVANEKAPMNVYWNNGLVAESANKEFTVHVGGFIEWDAGAYDAPASTVATLRALNANGFQDFQGNLDFRRIHLRVDGTFYENVDWVCELEFAGAAFGVVRPNHAGPGGTLSVTAANSTTSNRNNVFDFVGPTNVFCTVKDIPWLGNVRTGQWFTVFSLDAATPDKWGDFIERSGAYDAFVPNSNEGNFQDGIMFFDYNQDQTMSWWNALVSNNSNDPLSGIALGNDNFAWMGRLTWLPYYDEATNGRYMVHLGVDTQIQGLEGDLINYHDRGDVHEPYAITPSYVNLNVIGTYSELFCTEFATVWGPWFLQAETYFSEVNGSNNTGTAKDSTNLFFNGGYAEALYFLTGENRSYNKNIAGWNRVTPYENFFNMPGERTCCGLGAWSVGGRYSWIDLNDKGVRGGLVNEYTLGLNWYLNPNMRYMFNYCYTRVTDLGAAGATESVNGFGVRMTMDF